MQHLINISIDDVSPHPFSSFSAIEECKKLIEIFHDIKFTLFVPIAYWRTKKQGYSTPAPLFINEFPDFCEKLKELPQKNFEVAYHGLYHGIPGKSDNDEFKEITYEEAIVLFEQMKNIVKKSELSQVFKPFFRPPAWRMSAASFRAAKEAKIEILALSNHTYAKESYEKEDEKFSKVVYATCYPPEKELVLEDRTEIVYHACEWDKNFLDSNRAEELSKFLRNHLHEIKFCFLEELA